MEHVFGTSKQSSRKKQSFRERCVNLLGMRGYVFSVMLLICLVMLVVLWLLQVVYLENFYQSVKTRQINQAGDTIAYHLDDENLEQIALDVAESRQMCISVYLVPFPQVFPLGLTELVSVDVDGSCLIHQLTESSLQTMYEHAEQAGGVHTQRVYRNYIVLPRSSGNWWDRLVTPRRSSVPDSLVYTRVATNADGVSALILLNTRISPVSATVAVLRSQLIMVTLIIIVLALILSTVIARYLARPITELNQAAQQLAKGDFSGNFDIGGYREIGELAGTLNYAASELARTGQLQQDIVANISHDLRTPLTMIGGYAEFMRDFPDDDHSESINVIISETSRLTALVRDVLDYSQLQAGVEKMELRPFDFTGSLRECVSHYNTLMEKDGYAIVFSAECEVIVLGDEQRLLQAVGNMLNNAITHCGADKRVEVRQTCTANKVRVEIADHGPGIAENDLKNIWQRYYRTDATQRASHGSGLGLSIVKGILELHQADFGVKSEPGSGATFWFELPVLEE